MRILIVTQWFDPEPNNMKGLAFAKGLKEKGNQVEVLTGLPNYPTGKLHHQYKLKLYQKEQMEEIWIHRVLLYPSHNSKVFGRILNYVSFAFFASILSPFMVKGKFDVIYVYHPPATVMIPALILKKLKKGKLLLDINDLWPDMFRTVGMMDHTWFIKLMGWWMNYCYKKADRINVLSIGVKNLLILREVPFEEINVIPVWCNETILNRIENEEFFNAYDLHNSFVGIYAGAMGEAQHLETLIEAASYLEKSLKEFKLLLIGDGVCKDSLNELAKEKHLTNIIFIPTVPVNELTKILNKADFLLIHLKKEPLCAVTIPSKIAYYFNLEKPIVAGLEGDAAEVLKKSEGGILCESENANEITSAVLTLYHMSKEERDAMGGRGKSYYVKYMSMEAGIEQFQRLMEDMVKTVKV